MAICLNCDHENFGTREKCEKCGAKLEQRKIEAPAHSDGQPVNAAQKSMNFVKCYDCGYDNDPARSNCERCGGSLQAARTYAPLKPGKVTLVEYNVIPRCPHCEEYLDQIGVSKIGGLLSSNTTTIYICPHCHKLLSIGYDLYRYTG